MRPIVFVALGLTLSACGTVNRDATYIASDYEHAEKNVDVTVDTAEGPIVMKVRRHPLQKKILVLLDTGSLRRALAKDFGATNNALPKSAFEAAANKRLAEAEGPNCHTATPFMRQDYLWEFDYTCDAAPAPAAPKRR